MTRSGPGSAADAAAQQPEARQGGQRERATADDRGPDRKVAAIGIRVARGVTLHGFAVNADCDLTAFDRIVPCGIRDAGVTSITQELGRPVPVVDIQDVVERRLSTLLA